MRDILQEVEARAQGLNQRCQVHFAFPRQQLQVSAGFNSHAHWYVNINNVMHFA